MIRINFLAKVYGLSDWFLWGDEFDSSPQGAMLEFT